jgi:AcrR family transcriptional regulator
MKRDIHKQQIKTKVLDTARNLFLTRGYEKTTIKDILAETGITTGSLYHFFKDKEDILLHLAEDVFDTAATLADRMAGEDGNPWLRLSLELGIQLRAALNDRFIAGLYLKAYESGAISRLIVRRAHERNSGLFKDIQDESGPDDFYAVSLAIKGILHSFIGSALHDGERDDQTTVEQAITMILRLFGLPREEIEKNLGAMDLLFHRSTVHSR